MLVTPDGEILWRTRGRMTDDGDQELRTAVKEYFRPNR
jgi:hypothetical protein